VARLRALEFGDASAGGERARRNCLVLLRMLNPARPRRLASEGLGEAAASIVTDFVPGDVVMPDTTRRSRPEARRGCCDDDFRNTANLYRSTTPRANSVLPLDPFMSSTPGASTKSQSSSSESAAGASSTSLMSVAARSRSDFWRRPPRGGREAEAAAAVG